MTAFFEVYRQRLQHIRNALAKFQARYHIPTEDETEFDDGYRRPVTFGSEYVHYYTNYRIVLSADDLDDIEKKIMASAHAESGLSQSDSSAINYLLTMLEHRLLNLTDTLPFAVVSLGSDCLSRSVPTKWGVKPPRLLNEPSMPFDLAVHPNEAVADILERDFADYLEPSRLSFDSKLNFCVDTSRGILWNHEVGFSWANNGYAELIERYNRRIANFRAVQSSYRQTVYVLHATNPIDRPAARVIYRIARAVAAKHKRGAVMACICTSEKVNPRLGQLLAPIEWVDQLPLMMFNTPKPFAWYHWPTHQHFTMPDGLAFEQRIIENIVDAFRQISMGCRSHLI